MRIVTLRKRFLLVPLAIVLLCTFGLVSAAFAAGPGAHGKSAGTLPQAAQEHAGVVDHASAVDGIQNAMERIQRNVDRQVAHLEKVMNRVPDQAKSDIESTVQRMQDRLQTILSTLSDAAHSHAQPDSGGA